MRPVQPRRHRGSGQAQAGRHLLRREAVEVAQPDDAAVFRRKAGDAVQKKAAQAPAVGVVLGVCAGRRRRAGAVSVRRHFAAPPRLAARRHAPDDGPDPGARRRPSPVAVYAPPHGDPAILQSVAGGCVVARCLTRNRQEPRRAAPDPVVDAALDERARGGGPRRRLRSRAFCARPGRGGGALRDGRPRTASRAPRTAHRAPHASAPPGCAAAPPGRAAAPPGLVAAPPGLVAAPPGCAVSVSAMAHPLFRVQLACGADRRQAGRCSQLRSPPPCW